MNDDMKKRILEKLRLRETRKLYDARLLANVKPVTSDLVKTDTMMVCSDGTPAVRLKKTYTAKLEESEILEKLAELEHDQWTTWTKELLKRMHTASQTNNGLIAFMMGQEQRWSPNWIPYTELSEETKEHDRKWARKVLGICDAGYSLCYQKGLAKGLAKGKEEGYKRAWHDNNLDLDRRIADIISKEPDAKERGALLDMVASELGGYEVENVRGILRKKGIEVD